MTEGPQTTASPDDWMPLSTAPKDHSPIWVRGDNYGNRARGCHYCWAYWDGNGWTEAGTNGNRLTYVTGWKKS